MRILTFNGKFGYQNKEIHEGEVLLCHFEPGDNKKVIKSVIKKLDKKNSHFILVPFAHLHEKKTDSATALRLFDYFYNTLANTISKDRVVKIPFGIEKEFNLYAPAFNQAISFRHFKPAKENVKRFYTKNAIAYDKHMKETGHYNAQTSIFKKITPYIKEPIIDLAAGAGHLAKLLTDSGFKEVTFNDFSPAMKKLLQKVLPDSKITNEDATLLSSTPARSYKTIICCNLLFYIRDRNKALARWKKTLKKEGRMILIEEYPFLEPEKGKVLNKNSQSQELMDIINPLSPSEIKEIALDAGFKIESEYKVPIDTDHNLYALIFLKN